MIHRHLTVTGRVQGVYYRGWLVEQARAMGVTGWVRNRADGSVEAVVAGPAEQVDALIRRAHEGPPIAGVEHVLAQDAPAEVFDGFEQRPTL